MPLTIRSALTPLLGKAANGFVGHLVDVLGVVATILGVSVTIGFGVSQFVDGVYAVSGVEWLMNGDAEAPTSPWGSLSGFTEGLPASAAALDAEAIYAAGEQGRQFGWQSEWTTFYWAWWIAFSPLVGLSMAMT